MRDTQRKNLKEKINKFKEINKKLYVCSYKHSYTVFTRV